MKFVNFSIFSFILFFVIACGNNSSSSLAEAQNQEVANVIKVGASPVPHADILENIKPYLQEKGITLEIIQFSDYVLPNLSLNDGSIDANFFQHQPYLDRMVKDKDLKIHSIAKVHVEPIGVYSNRVTNIKDLKDGAVIAIPNDPSNSGRALILLHNNGIIKLKDPTNLYSTELDIIENPKKLKFNQLEAALLTKVLNDVDMAVINSNYALQANLKANDALLTEDSRSPYANILVVRDGDDREAISALKEALNSDFTKSFIENKYKGEIVPAF